MAWSRLHGDAISASRDSCVELFCICKRVTLKRERSLRLPRSFDRQAAPPATDLRYDAADAAAFWCRSSWPQRAPIVGGEAPYPARNTLFVGGVAEFIAARLTKGIRTRPRLRRCK